jgi:hypothetical protein
MKSTTLIGMRSAVAISVKPLLSSMLILAYCAVALPAATLEQLSLDEMIIKASSIVRGKVLNSYTTSNGPIFYTHYRIEVNETLKGQERTSTEFQLPGGVVNNSRQSFAGVPEFKAGDEYVFFLWAGMDGRMQVLGLTQGLFSVPAGTSADPVITRSASHEVMLERGTGKQIKDQTLTMNLSTLRTRIAYLHGTVQAAAK